MHGWVRGLSCKPNIYVSWSTSELKVRLAYRETGLSPPVKYFYWPQYFFCGSFVLFMSCVCHAFMSVHCCLVVTWREMADLLALVCDVYCDFVTSPILYLWTGVVLNCIDSWSLLSSYLYYYYKYWYLSLVVSTLPWDTVLISINTLISIKVQLLSWAPVPRCQYTIL